MSWRRWTLASLWTARVGLIVEKTVYVVGSRANNCFGRPLTELTLSEVLARPEKARKAVASTDS